MRIAIDCRPLRGNRTGIGRYLYEILDQFAHRNDDNQYYLYASGAIDIPQSCSRDHRFIIRSMQFRPSIVWLHIFVPLWIAQDRIQIFYGPNYAAPILRFRDYRTVITVHDATFIRYPDTMHWLTRIHNQIMLPLYARSADTIITDSLFSRAELEEVMGLDVAMIQAIHLAPTVLLDLPTKPANGRRKGAYILSVGTIEPRKNIKCLVKAYSMLPETIRNRYRLVLVGNKGWGGLEPDSWFKEMGVESQAEYLGPVDDDRLADLLHSAELFVFPSMYEGFGLPAVEALAAGVPLLCSFIPPLIELAGDAAVYFDHTSANDLCSKMERILQDVEQRTILAGLSKRRSRIYSWNQTADRTLKSLVGGSVT